MMDAWRARTRRSDPFQGLDTMELYTTHLHNLRPWDRPPSAMYSERMTRKTWWQINPPTLGKVFGVLLAFFSISFTIAFLPLVVNRQNLLETWRDIKRPSVAYEDATTLLIVWFFVHLFSSLAPWFVYISGGFTLNWTRFIPYFLMMGFECIWTDTFFYAGRIDLTLLVWIAILVCCVATGVAFWGAARIATLFMLPYMFVAIYGIVLSTAFLQVNGARYSTGRGRWLADAKF